MTPQARLLRDAAIFRAMAANMAREEGIQDVKRRQLTLGTVGLPAEDRGSAWLLAEAEECEQAARACVKAAEGIRSVEDNKCG